MSSKPSFEEARNAYAAVLGKGVSGSYTNLILWILAGQPPKEGGDVSTLFRDQVYNLDTMEIGAGDSVLVAKSGHRANTAKYITSGAAGIIYLGASGTIYKKIEITINKSRIEEEVKEAFLEAWFQTVLSLDKAVGTNIGKITRFFRDPSLVKKGGKNWWENNGAKATFYITMENIPNTFSRMLKKSGAKTGGKASIAAVKPRLFQLAAVLKHLDTTYGFRHRDLHQGNVMFTDDMNVKIIDFGRCCMNFEWSYGGRTALYTMAKWGTDDVPPEVLKGKSLECFSLDLFIFLISVIQDDTDMSLCSYSLQKMLLTMVTSSAKTGSTDLYIYLKSRSDDKVRRTRQTYSPFWDSYPWSFSSWEPRYIAALADTPSVFIDGFLAFVQSAEDAQYPEPARSVSASGPIAPKAAGPAVTRTGPTRGGYKSRSKKRKTRTRRYRK